MTPKPLAPPAAANVDGSPPSVCCSIKNLALRRGDRTIFSGFSLDVAHGEIVSIVGPSGCGKSSLFDVISGLLHPADGSILLSSSPNDPLLKDVTGTQNHTAYMFQDNSLLAWRTVQGNVLLPTELQNQHNPAGSRKRAIELLELFGLRDSLHLYPHQLSGGMRQRTAFARTFMVERPLYLFDEPFSSLDYLRQLQLELSLRRFLATNRKTCLLVTHDIEAAVCSAHRVVVVSGQPMTIRKSFRTGLDLHWEDPIAARKSDEFAALFRELLEDMREILEAPNA